MIITNKPIGNKLEDFEILNKIGSGGFATVYRAKCKQYGYDDQHVAIKMIDKKGIKNRRIKEQVESEIGIHSKLSHPAIVKFHTWFEDKRYKYLVLELCERGTLQEYLRNNGPLSEKDACHVIEEIIEGVRYLHSAFILHRDLSLANILFTDNMKIKIADFGMATRLSNPDATKHTMVGTPNFISPETFGKKSYNLKVDCWSVGCILYALLYNTLPFDGKTCSEIKCAATTRPLQFPRHASPDARKLLEGMLNKEPTLRPDINESLKYAFFQKYTNAYDRKSEFYLPKSGDSGLSSLSSLRSIHKNENTTGSASNTYGNIREIRNRHGHSAPDLKNVHVKKPSCYSSGSYCSLSGQQNEHESYRPDRYRAKTPGKTKNMLESQIEDVHIRSHSESPLPYPLRRLQNIATEDPLCSQSIYTMESNIYSGSRYSQCEMAFKNSEEHLLKATSCSHDCYCAPGVRCYHEAVCCCRHYQEGSSTNSRYNRSQPHMSHQKNDNSCIKLTLEKNTSAERKGLKGVVEPLTTMRLLPKRYETKNVIVSILDDGEVCLEFLKVKRNKKCVSNVCTISRDGYTICLYKPRKNIVPSSDPNERERKKIYNFENLPEAHWKKYQYAKRFIDIVKAKTPKVTIYDNNAKCMMMENSPDPNFEVNFYDGCLITQIGSQTTFTDQNGRSLAYESEPSTEVKFMWNVYTTMKERCKEHETCLEKLGSASNSSFPVIIGRKPTGSLASQEANKENTRSLHSSALNGALNGMKSYDITMSTNCSPLQNSLPRDMSSSLQKEKSIVTPFKSIVEILPNLKDMPRVENGKVLAEYKDGIQMWSSKDGRDVYFYDTGSRNLLTNIEQNQKIMMRVQHDLFGILLYTQSEEDKGSK